MHHRALHKQPSGEPLSSLQLNNPLLESLAEQTVGLLQKVSSQLLIKSMIKFCNTLVDYVQSAGLLQTKVHVKTTPVTLFQRQVSSPGSSLL